MANLRHQSMHSNDYSDVDRLRHSYREDSETPPGRKRSTRACDQCRKAKSKCEPSQIEGYPCSSCAASGIECLYLGPSHKRGPPKGYILALERRLHQAEAILGTILASPDPRARGLIKDMSEDEMAKNIMERINLGPFGPVGRLSSPPVSPHDHLAAAFVHGGGPDSPESSRITRQSRTLREQLSSADENLSGFTPTNHWQDGLLHRLSPASDSYVREKTPHGLSQMPSHIITSQKPSLSLDGLYAFDEAEASPSAASEHDAAIHERIIESNRGQRTLNGQTLDLNSRMIASMLGIDLDGASSVVSLPDEVGVLHSDMPLRHSMKYTTTPVSVPIDSYNGAAVGSASPYSVWVSPWHSSYDDNADPSGRDVLGRH